MLDFHRSLLEDETRTSAYRDAIRNIVHPGDVVLDLGSGTGILAFFACEAGARRVFAIEERETADAASLVARHNGIEERVTILHGRSTAIALPEPADLLITETLGVAGFDEGILSSVIDARARLLRAGAPIVPSDVVVSAVPVELPEVYDDRISWWSEPRYGVDFSPLRLLASNAMHLARPGVDAHLAEPRDVLAVNLATVSEPNVAGEAAFAARRAGLLHGFIAWFTATLAPEIVLSNRKRRATHWDQAFFPLEQPVAVVAGTPIALRLETCDGSVWRWSGRAGAAVFQRTTESAVPPCGH